MEASSAPSSRPLREQAEPSPDRLAQRAAELRDRLPTHPPQPLTREQLPEARITVIDKLASAVSLARCLNSVFVSLLDDKAILTLEQMVNLATIGANVAMRSRDLQEVLLEWMGAAQPWGPQGPGSRYGPQATGAAMLHVCRRSVRNGIGQDGTTRDAAG